MWSFKSCQLPDGGNPVEKKMYKIKLCGTASGLIQTAHKTKGSHHEKILFTTYTK
jgi:hypothetical protein